MYQVLFKIPIHLFGLDGIPIYGYGAMLFLAFICCTQFVVWRAKKEGFDKDRTYDMAFWIFLCGILGARIVFMIQYKVPIWDFYKVWEGGIVFYGSAIGGWVAYGIYRYCVRNKYQFSTWKLADVVAPTVCIGLILGRIGCLLNGCCYGQVCPECKWPTFPTMTAPARELTVEKRALQLTAGFATQAPERPVITAVEPHSPAENAGVKVGDEIVSVNDIAISTTESLQSALWFKTWPRGQSDVNLKVVRDGQQVSLPRFAPQTVSLQPTQAYESISMFLLFLLLLAFLPYRRYYGEAFALLMIGYAIHRFLNETLRDDTDPVIANLTLSQVISIAVLAAGIGLWIALRRISERVAVAAQPAPA